MSKKTEPNTIEIYSQWYFQELKDSGILLDYAREPETITVAPKVHYLFEKKFKRKQNTLQEIILFPEIEYTYDYRLIWNPEYRYIFFDYVITDAPVSSTPGFWLHGRPPLVAHLGEDGRSVSFLDVKPPSQAAQFSGKIGSTRSFPIKQRMIYDTTGIFINKFIPIPMVGAGKTSAMFIKTFTPRRYLLTDGGKQARKIRFKVVSLQSYINERRQIINGE